MGDICECWAEWLKEFISSLTVHREHKSAECFSPLLFASCPPCKICGSEEGGCGGVWAGSARGRELPTPTVLATCLENIQIACVICKPLSHPGGSYISCHYLGGPPIIVSCNNQLQHLVPRAEKPRLAPFFCVCVCFFFPLCWTLYHFLLTKNEQNASLKV